jgi:hypothetical protein
MELNKKLKGKITLIDLRVKLKIIRHLKSK